MTTIDINVTPVFTANRKAYERGYRRIVNQGSTRSSKTYSIIQLLISIAIKEPDKEISVCSPSLTHLKKGARKDFLDQMEGAGLFREEEFNRTDNVYTFKRTGSYIEFFGADESGRLRGPGRDILYINEANLIPDASYTQLAIRTRQTIFVDFNPADEFSYVYDLAIGPDAKFIHSTYRNNRANLTSAQIDEIERLEGVDENLWKVFGLGLRGTSSETIYTHWKRCKDLPLRGELFAGLDFGYNVPTALVMIEHLEGANYVDELLYETKLTTSELIERLGPNGLNFSRTMELFCDNAEPKTIQELCNAGFNALPADKDVREGIRKVKGMPLYITERSANVIKEIKSYKWKITKDGKVLDEPVKMNDHACFASGTLISMADGSFKPIETVNPGDWVLNSSGPCRVVRRFNNGIKNVLDYLIQFDTGSLSLTSTQDHKIKTSNGWKIISKLRSGTTVYLSRYSTAAFTSCTRGSDISLVTDGGFMSTSGKQRMGSGQRGTMCTTLTKTAITTGCPTLRLRSASITYPSIRNVGWQKTRNGLPRSLPQGFWPLRSGIRLPRVSNGTDSTQFQRTLGGQICPKRFASNVRNRLSRKLTTTSIAAMRANPLRDGHRASTTWRGIAFDASRPLLQTDMIIPSIAQKVVLEKITGANERKAQVWDLEIEGVHEYFANGLLVSNCDAMRYGIFTKLSRYAASWDALE